MSNKVYVDIVYKTVKASELARNYNTYKKKYVKVTGLRIVSSKFDGLDLYVLAKSDSSYIYVLIEQYSRWFFETDGGLYGKTKVQSFWAAGLCTDERRSSQYGSIPVVNAELIQPYY